MGIEIERKYLVLAPAWRAVRDALPADAAESLRQGYLSAVPERTVRVRTAGPHAWLTIKGRSVGATRAEYEYEIPCDDARELLDRLCQKPLVEKVRWRFMNGADRWVVDEFSGANQGLVLAEIELSSEDEPFDLPAWAGVEVTDDRRYHNSSLVARPYSTWGRTPESAARQCS